MNNIVFALASLFTFTSSAFANDAANEMGRKLLEAMGGAENWANVRTVHNTAVNHHPQARLPYIQEYWYDTHAPAHYIKINNFDMNRIRAYTADGGWSLTEGKIEKFSSERLENEINSWNRSLYRKLYLLATADSGLSLAIGQHERLEFTFGDQFIGWFMLAESGAPIRHGGTPSTENYTEFDELAEFGEINSPRSGRDNDGWRFEILSVRISADAPPVDFSPPSSE